ncbi:MAG: MarR family winged helix-turn-helix transcriptional regulator [Steroidobacteraceae bacterium]
MVAGKNAPRRVAGEVLAGGKGGAGRQPGSRGARRAVQPDAQRPRVSYLIGRLDRALRKRMNEALAPSGLSLAQYTVLSVLQARGELSNAQLASRAFITPQAMNEVVQTLEAHKLVTRRHDPTHGRIVRLTLTARGLDNLRACDSAVHTLEQSMLARLSQADRETLHTSLTACVQTLEGHAESAK